MPSERVSFASDLASALSPYVVIRSTIGPSILLDIEKKLYLLNEKPYFIVRYIIIFLLRYQLIFCTNFVILPCRHYIWMYMGLCCNINIYYWAGIFGTQSAS